MRPAWLLPLALLAGCAWFRRDPPPVIEETPQERACRVEAATAPEVRALSSQANPDSIPNTERLDGERRLAENRAFVACLRRAGVATPGGVEAPRER